MKKQKQSYVIVAWLVLFFISLIKKLLSTHISHIEKFTEWLNDWKHLWQQRKNMLEKMFCLPKNIVQNGDGVSKMDVTESIFIYPEVEISEVCYLLFCRACLTSDQYSLLVPGLLLSSFLTKIWFRSVQGHASFMHRAVSSRQHGFLVIVVCCLCVYLVSCSAVLLNMSLLCIELIKRSWRMLRTRTGFNFVVIVFAVTE